MTSKEQEILADIEGLSAQLEALAGSLKQGSALALPNVDRFINALKKVHEKAIVLRYLHANQDSLSTAFTPPASEPDATLPEDTPAPPEAAPEVPEAAPAESAVETPAEPDNNPPIDLERLDRDIRNLGIPEADQLPPNERTAAAGEQSVADKWKHQPIHNLKSAIGLNERFLFANALFAGSMEAFNQALEELNHMQSLDDAKRFIAHQGQKYAWDNNDPAVADFSELVERRFL
ncbi:MAG: hypothetical protein AAGB22_07075 [Bacteroidota bacterium]